MQFTLWKNVNLHLEETTMMPSSIQQRLGDLRQFMAEHGLQAFVVPTTDPHASEYTPLHYESRKWLTGFSGSAGTAVVTLYDAALWTDSRYFIAAAEELRDTGIQLMKEGMNATPGIAQWLANQLRQGDCVGLDGMVNPVGVVQQLQHDLMPAGISVNCQWDPFESIWENRPPLPLDTIKVHPLQYAGEKAEDKTKRLRQRLSQRGCTGMLVSALDEIAWLLNLRGSDVHCTIGGKYLQIRLPISLLLKSGCRSILRLSRTFKSILQGACCLRRMSMPPCTMLWKVTTSSWVILP